MNRTKQNKDRRSLNRQLDGDDQPPTRVALFDLVAAGQLRLSRSGAELLLQRARVIELLDQGNNSP